MTRQGKTLGLVRTVPSRIRWRVDTSISPPLFARVGNKLSYVERSSIIYKIN